MKHFFLCCWLAVLQLYSIGQTNTCKDSSFGKTYAIQQDKAKAMHQLALSDNGILLTGEHTPSGGGFSRGLFMRLNAGGVIQDSRESAMTGTAGNLQWNMAIELKSKDLVLGGYAYKTYPTSTNTIILTKKNAAFNSLWARQYILDPLLFGEETVLTNTSITEADNGDLILMVSFYVGTSVIANDAVTVYMIARINSVNGNIVWSKTFDAKNQRIGFAFSVLSQPGEVVVLGYMEVDAIATNLEPRTFYAMKLSAADGNMQLLKRYRYKQTSSYTGAWGNYFKQYKGIKTANGFEMYGEPLDLTGAFDRNLMLIQLDNNLDLIRSKCWKLNYFPFAATETLMDTNGNISALFRDSGPGKAYYSAYNLHDAAGYKRTRDVNVPDSPDDFSGEMGDRIVPGGNGNVTLLFNYHNNGDYLMSLTKLTPADTLASCTGKEMKPSQQEMLMEFEPFTLNWGGIYSNGLGVSAAVLSETAVAVTESDVCKVVNPLPAIALGNDTSFCFGQQLTLQAPNGFREYRWNTGATTPAITIKQAGIYKVEAVFSGGCTATDEMEVKEIYALPAHFMAADTSFCLPEHSMLQPYRKFSQYTWSDGSHQPFLAVSQPGTYELTVTDENGCAAKASIKVATKSCVNSIYIPTAFSPDGNGKNDVFKPVVTGRLAKYEFSVYNRWGQPVFVSANPAQGWNGSFKGQPQDLGSYAWMCRYQFEGGQEKVEKGTVVLFH